MKKIIEGIFGFKGNGDFLFAETENLTYEEKELLSANDLSFANLAKVDKERGLVDVVTEINEVTCSYSFKKIKDGTRLLFCKHKNIIHDNSDRGRVEVIHFLNLDSDVEAKSASLSEVPAIKSDIKQYVLSDTNSLLKPIVNLESENELSFEDFIRNKDQIIDILNHIIFAKKSSKTLYICYKISEINQFHDAFFKALKLLPKEVSNSISYVSCYGGSSSDLYDVIGVAIEPSKIKEMDFESGGVLLRFPYSEYLSGKEEIISNPLHEVLNSISQKLEYASFQRFIKNNYQDEASIESYLKFVEFYRSINFKNEFVENKEYQFVIAFNDCLSFYKDNIEVVEQFDKDTLIHLYQNLEGQVNCFSKLLDLTAVDVEVNNTIKLLFDIYNLSKNIEAKEDCINWIYSILFDFDYSFSDTKYISIRSDWIDKAIISDELSDLLFAHILSNDALYNAFEEMSVALTSNESGIHTEQALYSKLFSYLFARYELDSLNRTRIVDVVAKHLVSLINVADVIELIFQIKDDIRKCFYIVSSVVVSLDDEVLDGFLHSLNNYVTNNGLITEALLEVRLGSYSGSNREKVFKLKSYIIDSYIGKDEVTTYEDLLSYVLALQVFKENKVVFEEINNRFISNHFSSLAVDDFEELPLSAIRKADPKNLEVLYDTFKTRHEPLPKRLIQCIKDKKEAIAEYERIKGRENELIDFRITFIVRAVSLLPEKESREICYKYINKELADKYINPSLNLSKEQYSENVSTLADIFLHEVEEKDIINGKSMDHLRFTKEIIESQNKKRFNIHTVATLAESFANLIIFGGATLLLAFGLSLLFYNFVTNKTYLTSYIIISIVVGALSGIVALVNVKNKGRYNIYLISTIECLLMVLVGTGLFTLLALLFGGR